MNDLTWRKSTFSNGNGGSCVEVADVPGGGRAVRDTKLGEASPVLWYTEDEWKAFLDGVRDGQFD